MNNILLFSLEDYQAYILRLALGRYIEQNPDDDRNNNVLYGIIDKINELLKEGK